MVYKGKYWSIKSWGRNAHINLPEKVKGKRKGDLLNLKSSFLSGGKYAR